MGYSSASAESVDSSTLSVTIKPVISIRVLDSTAATPISSLNIDIAPTPNGTTASKSAVVDVATSNETGYTLYMNSDYQDNSSNYTTSLINTDSTIATTIPTSVPASASATNYWNYAGSWNETISGAALSGSTGTKVIPAYNTPDMLRDDVEDPVESSQTTVAISVNVDNDIPAGTYRNKLVFTAVANELPPALPAFWNITTMQEMTPEVCASVYTPNNTVAMTDNNIITKARALAGDYTVTADNTSPLVPETTLLDDRDADGTGTKKSYTVRKLADGNCWMTDNLEYDLLSLYNNGKRGIGSRNDGSTFEMTDANLASGVAGYYTTTANEYNYVINPNTKKLTNITRNSYIGNVTGQTEYYYNWTAATAGQGSQSNTSGTIDGSICPAGWRLPTNYTDTANRNISWSALTNAYLNITTNTSTTTGYQTLEQYPISLYRAGGVLSGSQDVAAYGYYWSSTANNAGAGYALDYYTSRVYPQSYYGKGRGFQLRCVANPAPPKTLHSISTMQEMTPTVCANTTTPAVTAKELYDTDGSHAGDTSYVPQATLTDTRDENTYTVRKLADGNCWMTQNLRLRLTAGQALTNQNTDLNSRTSWTPTVTTQTTTGTKWGSNGSAGTTGTTNDQYAAVEHSYWDNLALQDGDGISQPRGSYYNWYTATAMSGTWNMGANGAENAPDSICPKGWRLPPNSGDKSFQNLIVTTYQLLTTPGAGNASARNALMKNPFSYTYSGLYYWSDGSIASGSGAYFWSSEAYATTYAHNLYFNSNGYVYPQGGDHMPYGFSVRCVLR